MGDSITNGSETAAAAMEAARTAGPIHPSNQLHGVPGAADQDDPFANLNPHLGADNGPDPDDPFADAPRLSTNTSSATAAFASHAARGVAPTLGGMAAAGTGAEIGAELGALGGPAAWATVPIGGFLGGLAGFFAGSAATEGAQDFALHQAPDSWQEAAGQSDRQQRVQEAQHPYASFMGGIAPYALTMSPGSFTATAKELPENATAFQKLMANPVTARAFGGAAMGGMELGQEEWDTGTPDWAKVGISTGFGMVFNKPTRFGEYLTHAGGAPVRAAFGGYVPKEGILNPSEPTVAEANDRGIMGAGVTESTFQGGEERSLTTRTAAQNTAAEEQALMGPLPAPDTDLIARRMEPDLFRRNDELLGQRDALRSWINAQSNPTEDMFAEVAAKRYAAEEALRNANPNGPAARNFRAELADISAQEADLTARREAWESGTHVDTDDIMLARQHLVDTEHALWDIGPEMSAARRRAADHVGEELTEPESHAVPKLTPGETPNQEASPAQISSPPTQSVETESAPKSIEAQRAFITSDRTAQLMAAGLSRQTAEASVAVEAAYYETLAQRFGGALGTPEELYRARAARVVGPSGPPATPAAPITRAAPIPEPTPVSSPEVAPPTASQPPEVTPVAPPPSVRPRIRTTEQIIREDGIPRNAQGNLTPANAAKVIETQQNEMVALADWQAEQRAVPKEPLPSVAPLVVTPEKPTVEQHTIGNGGLESLDPASIGIDANRFQFKANADESGVTDRLQGVKQWDPRLAGTAVVFRDADGKNWIADGHQRLALANRLTDEGQSDIRLNAFVLDAKDGITDADARSIAAAKNIAEGTGTSIDAAKIIRQSAENGIELPPLPPRSTLVRDGQALARLSPDAFGMVVNDVIPPAQGAIVGRLVTDPLQQVEAVRVLAKAQPSNLRQAELITRDVMETSREAVTQGGLFGEEHFAASATLERAKVADEALRQLSRDRAVFRSLVDEVDRIQANGGNLLDIEANQFRLSADEQAREFLTQLATRKGPVSDALTGIARRVRDGELSISTAAREFTGIVRADVARELAQRSNPGGAIVGTAGERDLLGRPIEQTAVRASEPTIRNDERQIDIPGTEPSAVQAQAARDNSGPREGQLPPDDGLFAAPRPDQPDLLQASRTIQGRIRITPGDVRSIITLAKTADASTFLHETGHDWLKQILRDSLHELAPDALKSDAATIRAWLKRPEGWTGFKRDGSPDVGPQERFARGFEQYLREGHAPSRALDGVFAQFKAWLTKIYQTLRGLGAPISDDIRSVFDRMLSIEPQRRTAGEVPERGPSIADIHETDAAETAPHEAEAVRDRVVSERDRYVAGQPPEIANGFATESGSSVEPAGEGGGGSEASGALESGGGQSQPVAGAGGGGSERGTVQQGGAAIESKSSGVGQGTSREPNPANGRRGAGAGAGVEQLAPEPAETLSDAESRLVDLAGNIRVENLTDIESIAQAIHESADRNDDFKAVRGGTTKGRMNELADALGLDASKMDETILTRVLGGTENLGVRILAARKLVVQSAEIVSGLMKRAAETKTDQDVGALGLAIARHDMIQSALSGVTAEWGRAGNAFHSLLEGWGKAQDLNQLLKDNLGRDLYQLRVIANLGSRFDTPGKISKYLRDAKNRSFGGMILEYWVNGLISGPATHATYVVGNAMLAGFKAGPETAAAAMIGALRNRGERVHFGEVGAQLRAAYREAPGAAQAAIEALKSGATTQLPGETARPWMAFQGDTDLAMSRAMTNAHVTWSEVAGDAYGLIQGMRDGFVAAGSMIPNAPFVRPEWSPLGQIPDIGIGKLNVPVGTLARLPSRMVASIHSGFRAINYSMAVNALAYRQAAEEGLTGAAHTNRVGDLRQNPTPEMMETARGIATDQTLMGQGGKLTQTLSKFFNQTYNLPVLGDTAVLKFVDPFVHIAGQIMSQSLMHRTPIGLLAPEIRADIMGRNGNIAQDTAMAKMLVGTSLAVTFGGLAAQGLVSGSGPAEPNKAAMWRLAGNQAHSIRVGDIWYDVHRLGPLGMLMSVSADMYDVAHQIGTEDADVVGKSLMHAFTQNILDESFMRGPSDLIKAVTDPDRYGSGYVRNFVASFLPYSVGMAQMARASDPYSRQARTIMDAIRARVPGLSESLFPRRDIWGDPMPSGDALLAPGVTAVYERKMSADPVNQAMLSLSLGPAPVERQIRNVPLNDQQYDDFARIAGRTAKMQLDAMVRSPTWQIMPNEARHVYIEAELKAARDAARGWVMMKYPEIPREAALIERARKTGETIH